MKTEDFGNKKPESTREESSSLFEDAYNTVSKAATSAASEVANHPVELTATVATGLAAIALARRGQVPELGPAVKSLATDATASSKHIFAEAKPLAARIIGDGSSELKHVSFPAGSSAEAKAKAIVDASGLDLSHVRFPVGANTQSKAEAILNASDLGPGHVHFPLGGDTESKVKAILDTAHTDLSHSKFPLDATTDDKVKAILDNADLGPGHVEFRADADIAAKAKAILKESERQ